jgi:hypothetical protein
VERADGKGSENQKIKRPLKQFVAYFIHGAILLSSFYNIKSFCVEGRHQSGGAPATYSSLRLRTFEKLFHIFTTRV